MGTPLEDIFSHLFASGPLYLSTVALETCYFFRSVRVSHM